MDGQPTPADPKPQTTVSSTAVAEPPETAETPIPETQSPEATETPVVEHAQEPTAATVQSDQNTSADEEIPEEEPGAEYVPWGTPAIGVGPTASVMVARGMERFDADKCNMIHNINACTPEELEELGFAPSRRVR